MRISFFENWSNYNHLAIGKTVSNKFGNLRSITHTDYGLKTLFTERTSQPFGKLVTFSKNFV